MQTHATFLLLLFSGCMWCAECQLSFTAEDVSADVTVGTDPEGDTIDEEAFKARYLLDGAAIADLAAEADSLEADGASLVDYDAASGQLIARPIPLRCRDGPIRTIFREEDRFYFPPIRVSRCRRLPCPNNSPCLARRTVTRNVWAICYKRFNCWGLILWIPIAVQRLCVEDEFRCECKECSDIVDFRECVNTKPCPNETNANSFCYWKPCKLPPKKDFNDVAALSVSTSTDDLATAVIDPRLWGECDCCRLTPCPVNQFFDRRLCKCRCRPHIICEPPFVLNCDTCRCECPRTNDCGPRMKWNPITCRCECKPFFCFPPRLPNLKTCECECPQIYCPLPFELDPSSCQCRCPKNIYCPPGKVLDHSTCTCICPCEQITDQATCASTPTCVNRPPNHQCRWFPTFPQIPCQCECCEKKNPLLPFDCGSLSPFGQFVCNFYVNHATGNKECQWTC